MKTKLIKIGITLVSTIIICGLMLFTSCHTEERYLGSVEIIERSVDNSLQDSVIIYGYVLVRDMHGKNRPPYLYERPTIKILETETTTQSNDSGYFSIKMLHGTYTIECFFPSTPWNGNPKLENIKISPNEKIKVKFIKERVH
jgi:hypothetical protein